MTELTGRSGVLFLLRIQTQHRLPGVNFPGKAAYPDAGSCNCLQAAAYFAKGMYY
jgi:hypothetical protein